MQTVDGLAGLRCMDCQQVFDSEFERCQDCNGALEPIYDQRTLERAHEGVSSGEGTTALPFASERLVSLAEGTTPLVACPSMAEDGGRVLLKSEGRNGTGGITDRGMAVAVTAARERGATDVALPTTGNGGQSAAAYASRAGLDSHSFVPSRTTFANKAMINVHGGDMQVVGGRYPDAYETFEESVDDGWYSLAPFETPFRHEGHKRLATELVADLGHSPDALVCPVGHGTWLVGIYRGFRELEATGTIDRSPRLYAAQAAGCAPLVDAFDADMEEPVAQGQPDTICGPVEIPDPAGGRYVLNALEATDGGAVESDDEAILEAAVSMAGDGIPVSATGGVAVAGATRLRGESELGPGEIVVLVDPATPNREADVLRSHLMRKGI